MNYANQYPVFKSNLNRLPKILNPELVRKSVHLTVCLVLFYSIWAWVSIVTWLLLTIAIVFVLVADISNLSSYLKRVGRRSYGQYLLIGGITLAFIFFQNEPNGLALMFSFGVVALADPLATLGPRVNHFFKKSGFLSNLTNIQFGKKTATGSLIFLTTLIIIASILAPVQLLKLTIASLILTLIELKSLWGLDNLVLPGIAYFLFLL